MIQCKDCEFFIRREDGQVAFSCDPFSTIKEPECLEKWQLIKTNQLEAGLNQVAKGMETMVRSYQATLEYYHKLAPMQEKMFEFMEREMDDISEADKWKIDDEEETDDWGPGL